MKILHMTVQIKGAVVDLPLCTKFYAIYPWWFSRFGLSNDEKLHVKCDKLCLDAVCQVDNFFH